MKFRVSYAITKRWNGERVVEAEDAEAAIDAVEQAPLKELLAEAEDADYALDVTDAEVDE